MSLPIADKKTRPDIILIHGNPGTGKTTAAEKYCKMKGYKPIVFDVNNTNFTSMPNLDMDFSMNHLGIMRQLTHWIPKIKPEGFDTIVFEDIGNLIEKLTPKADKKNNFAHTQARATFVKDLMKCLNASGCNIIFLGQSDMIIKDYENKDDNESYSKPIVLINAIVNWAYYTYKPNETTFAWKCTKYRGKPGVLYE